MKSVTPAFVRDLAGILDAFHGAPRPSVEKPGFEPGTSCMPCRRSTKLSYIPKLLQQIWPSIIEPTGTRTQISLDWPVLQGGRTAIVLPTLRPPSLLHLDFDSWHGLGREVYPSARTNGLPSLSRESNPGPSPYEGDALATELERQVRKTGPGPQQRARRLSSAEGLTCPAVMASPVTST